MPSIFHTDKMSVPCGGFLTGRNIVNLRAIPVCDNGRPAALHFGLEPPHILQYAAGFSPRAPCIPSVLTNRPWRIRVAATACGVALRTRTSSHTTVCCGVLASCALHSVRSDKPAVANPCGCNGLRRCTSDSLLATGVHRTPVLSLTTSHTTVCCGVLALRALHPSVVNTLSC